MSNPEDGPLCPHCNMPLLDRGDGDANPWDIEWNAKEVAIADDVDGVAVWCANCGKLLALLAANKAPKKRRRIEATKGRGQSPARRVSRVEARSGA